MPSEIRTLSNQILSQPVRIEVTPVATTAEKIEQAIYFAEKGQKTSLLIHLVKELDVQKGLVFTRTKREANLVSEALNASGIRAEAIHGNKSQSARERALDMIKTGECRILVATDIAARGIDIDRVTHVFNHDIPNISESYVHRIGRTARAGTEGKAYSFCAGDEKGYLSDIEKLIRKRIPVLATPEGLPVLAKRKGLSPRANQPKGGRGFQSKHPMRSGSSLRNSDRPKLDSRFSNSAGPSRPRVASRDLPKVVQPVSLQGQKPVHANPPPSPNNRKNRRRQMLSP